MNLVKLRLSLMWQFLIIFCHGCGARSSLPIDLSNDLTSVGGDGSGADNSAGGTVARFQAKAISAGDGIACAVITDGTVQCWGGQLGSGLTTDINVPVAVFGISNAVSVAANGTHGCALLEDTTIRCWGSNYNGQLGNGSTADSLTPVPVTDVSQATAITAGIDHTCALLRIGTIKCWGYNHFGQLGNGTTGDVQSTPVIVLGVSQAVSISAGASSACALLTNGIVQCWGSNRGANLGDGTTVDRATPVTVAGVSQATIVSAGGGHTCARLVTEQIQCWGSNLDGELGAGANANGLTPVYVSNMTQAVSVAAGDYNACAILLDGTLKCWGANDTGQLGNGTTSLYGFTPVNVLDISNATSVAIGWNSVCALLTTGGLQCWGDNRYGQLGDGTTQSSSKPVTVVGF